ncbi:MAG TPA: hypothetical protein VHC48_19675, partial [Puia sp.]|nr:hypothetical protein [Puia sp.]
MNMSRLLVLWTTLILLFSACKHDLSQPSPAVVNPPSSAANEAVNVWVTTGDKSKLLQSQPTINFAADGGTSPTTITIDETRYYQSIDGFGYCLTGGSATLINSLGPGQTALLNELFGTGSGQIGVSYLRVSLGASDLSASTFTYDDVPAGETDVNLTHFSISQEMTDLVPVLKNILTINPSIKILACPWSAPVWMKTNGSFKGG